MAGTPNIGHPATADKGTGNSGVGSRGLVACGIGSLCHVRRKDLAWFGTRFSRSAVLRMASSSAQVVYNTENTATRVASGTLIWPNVVLAASHTFNDNPTKFEILFSYECDEQTAPLQSNSPCTELATIPQATVTKVLDDGDRLGLDYVLLAIEWNNQWRDYRSAVQFRHGLRIPRPGQKLSPELLVVGHPGGQPTQASAGKLLIERGPHPTRSDKNYKDRNQYSYASFNALEGLSGGGVYNEGGELVGVLTGGRELRSSRKEVGFLNLWSVVNKSSRLSKWFGGSSPLIAGDPPAPVVLGLNV